MRSRSDPNRIHLVFHDHRLVANAGLLLPASLALRLSLGEDTLMVYVEDTGSTATIYTDTGTTPGTRHLYRVKAVNSAGAGERSNFVRATP